MLYIHIYSGVETFYVHRETLCTYILSCYIYIIRLYVHREIVCTKSLSCCIYIFKVAKKDCIYIERLYVHTFSPVIYKYIYRGEKRLYVRRETVSTKSLSYIYIYIFRVAKRNSMHIA